MVTEWRERVQTQRCTRLTTRREHRNRFDRYIRSVPQKPHIPRLAFFPAVFTYCASLLNFLEPISKLFFSPRVLKLFSQDYTVNLPAGYEDNKFSDRRRDEMIFQCAQQNWVSFKSKSS